MQLPENNRLDIAKLATVFTDTTNSYKFYWFLAILDNLKEKNSSRISMQDLSIRMLANVWYPLDYFKLSFGKQDGFKSIAGLISSLITIDNSPNAPNLFNQLNSLLATTDLIKIQTKVDILLRWVPYRFIRPFFLLETKGLPEHRINTRIVELSNKTFRAPYRLLGTDIEINDEWVDYLQQHQTILRGFIFWHLLKFIQKNNPHVIGLSEKLERPSFRKLETARKFWNEFISEKPIVKCIYSGQLINPINISLDHFLPWSFVVHDQLWNIIPTLKAVNSAKNNWLPSLSIYFEAYAKIQYDCFQYHASKGHEKILEDYSLLFALNLDEISKQSFVIFRGYLERHILPQIQMAQNMGFQAPFVYRTT